MQVSWQAGFHGGSVICSCSPDFVLDVIQSSVGETCDGMMEQVRCCCVSHSQMACNSLRTDGILPTVRRKH